MNDRDFYIGDDFERLPEETIEKLKSFGACVVSDAMKGFNTMTPQLARLSGGRKGEKCIVGQAVTIRLRPGDNLMLHRAIEKAAAGDIIVMDTCANYRTAVIGGIMSGAAFDKGIAGMVVDGVIRDIEELRENDFSYWAMGTVTGTGDSEGPGQLNVPISCGGVPVAAGDIIVADDNGVAVVPQKAAEWVIAGAEKKLEAEAKRIAEIAAGQLTGAKVSEKLDRLNYR